MSRSGNMLAQALGGNRFRAYSKARLRPSSGTLKNLTTDPQRGLIRDLDPRIARAVALDQSEQGCRMRGVQPDAAVRGGTAEPGDIVGAMNGEAVIEENRVRHRRVVIFAREIAAHHRLRVVDAARRAVAVATG